MRENRSFVPDGGKPLTDSQAKWCASCKEEAEEAAFCRNCGSKLVENPPLETQNNPFLESGSAKLRKPRKMLSKGQKIASFAVVGALVLGGISATALHYVEEQRSEQLAQEAEAAAVEAAVEKHRLESESLTVAFSQTELSGGLPSCKDVRAYAAGSEGSWENIASEFDGVSDPREASKVLKAVKSKSGTLDEADVDGYAETFETQVLVGLESVFSKSIRDDFAPRVQLNSWVEDWLVLVSETCPTEHGVFEATLRSLSASAAKFSRMETLAGQVPWYPEGYSELRAGVAFKWVDAARDCRSCYQWTMDFISQSSCSSVYGKIDVLDSSGRVISWTNETLGSVRAGEVGRLTFQKYGGSGTLTARVSEFNCR